MIHNKTKHITLVVYDQNKAAKCFEIKKQTVKVFVSLIVLIVLATSIASLYSYGHFKDKIKNLKAVDPKVVKELRSTNTSLSEQNEDLLADNKRLLNKLKQTDVSGEFEPILGFFKPVLNQQDLSSQKQIQVENFNVKSKTSSLEFVFNIINPTPDKSRRSGHIFVIMKSGPFFSIYPDTETSFEDYITSFDKGETFNVSRFRPVISSFKKPSQLGKLYFKVVIFSREGDLIYTKNTGPFSLKEDK